MRVLSVGFYYPGKRSNVASEEASEDLKKAEEYVMNTFNAKGIKCVHQYAWTDGSLYKFIATDLSENEIVGLFDPTKARVMGIYEKNPSDYINEARKVTFAEEFGLKIVKICEAGNTDTAMLNWLFKDGYTVSTDKSCARFTAKKDGKIFTGMSIAGLLGVIMMFEKLGDNWGKDDEENVWDRIEHE